MPFYQEDRVVVINSLVQISIPLGDGHDDRVEDRSAGRNFITLGDGHRDFVDTIGRGDVITLGDGLSDSVVDRGTGDNTVVLGNGFFDSFGANSVARAFVTLGNGDFDSVQLTNNAGGNTFILGNGLGDVVRLYGSSGPDRDRVTLGHGSGDVVTLTTNGLHPVVVGVADVTFGGPDAVLNLSPTAGPSFMSPTTVAQIAVDTRGLDVISGLIKGDRIGLSGGSANPDTPATTLHLAGVSNEGGFAIGLYH